MVAARRSAIRGRHEVPITVNTFLAKFDIYAADKWYGMNTIRDLLRPARTPCGEDDGSCIFYMRLSYRRRFLRDIFWAPLFSFIALTEMAHGHAPKWTPLVVAIYLASPIFNFIQWSKLER